MQTLYLFTSMFKKHFYNDLASKLAHNTSISRTTSSIASDGPLKKTCGIAASPAAD